MNNNAKIRQAVLEVLYKEREAQAGMVKDGWTAEVDLKNAVGNVTFALSVLEEIGQVKRDGYLLRITGAGVLACESGCGN
jgi:hypothetical protein